MADRYDLLTSRKDREGKTRYHKIGVMFPSKNRDGFAIKLESLPLPNENGETWISAFVPRENDGERPAKSAGKGSAPASFDDDAIPFQSEFR